MTRRVEPSSVMLLLEAGANPNARDEGGDTPLHAAARGGTAEVVMALLQAGADPAARDNNRELPFNHAEDNEQLKGTDAYRKLAAPIETQKKLAEQGEVDASIRCPEYIGVTSRNGKNRTLRPIERRAGPELALFNLLVQPPAMVQNIVAKELDRLGHARVGVPGSGRSCSPKRSRCGDRAWRSPEPSLSGRTL